MESRLPRPKRKSYSLHISFYSYQKSIKIKIRVIARNTLGLWDFYDFVLHPHKFKSSHLNLVRNLINTPLGVKVFISFMESCLPCPKRKRVIASTFPSNPIKSLSKSRFKSSGERLWIYETLWFHPPFSPHGFDSRTSESKIWFMLALSESLWSLKIFFFLLCIGFKKV